MMRLPLLSCLAAFAILFIGPVSGADTEPKAVPGAPTRTDVAAPVDPERAPFVGGWYSGEETEPDGEHSLGRWYEFRADGTYRVLDGFGGFQRQFGGRWSLAKGVLRIEGTSQDGFRREGANLRRLWEGKPDKLFTPSNSVPEKIAALSPLPKSVDEAVAALKDKLSEANLEQISLMREEDLIGLHFGLGTWIRNAFGLWGGNGELLASCGSADMHPDDASGIIIHALWKSLRDARPDASLRVELERRLALPVRPFSVRKLTCAQFVEKLNEAMGVALAAAGEPADSVRFVAVNSPGVSADTVISTVPLCRVWGTTPEDCYRPTQLDRYFWGVLTVLKPPSTVEVSFEPGNGWIDRPDEKRSWETLSWQGGEFEAGSFVSDRDCSQSSFFPGVYRSMSWSMASEKAPLSVSQAIGFFDKSQARAEGEKVVSVALRSDSGLVSSRDDEFHFFSPKPGRRVWSYDVSAYLRPINHFKPGAWKQYGSWETRDGKERQSTLTQAKLGSESVWKDLLQEPPLSPDDALAALRKYLAKKKMYLPEGGVFITLQRVWLGDLWYYEIRASRNSDGCYGLRAFVRLDGKVIPFDGWAE